MDVGTEAAPPSHATPPEPLLADVVVLPREIDAKGGLYDSSVVTIVKESPQPNGAFREFADGAVSG